VSRAHSGGVGEIAIGKAVAMVRPKGSSRGAAMPSARDLSSASFMYLLRLV
jgi:hypothetical protein